MNKSNYQYDIVNYSVVLFVLQSWTNVKKPFNHLEPQVDWPEGRYGHAAACVSGSLLVIVGGVGDDLSTISDCWIYDFIMKTWNEV